MKKDNIFKKNSQTKKEAAEKLSKMWDLWVEGNIPSPYADLMTYKSEVNNGGHAQFFHNVSKTGHLRAVMRALDKLLPFDTKPALVEAYHAWQVNGAEAEENENFFIAADEWFEKKEKIIDKILENYSITL